VAGGRGMQTAKLSARPHFVLNNLCGNVCHTHEYALKRYVAVFTALLERGSRCFRLFSWPIKTRAGSSGEGVPNCMGFSLQKYDMFA